MAAAINYLPKMTPYSAIRILTSFLLVIYILKSAEAVPSYRMLGHVFVTSFAPVQISVTTRQNSKLARFVFRNFVATVLFEPASDANVTGDRLWLGRRNPSDPARLGRTAVGTFDSDGRFEGTVNLENDMLHVQPSKCYFSDVGAGPVGHDDRVGYLSSDLRSCPTESAVECGLPPDAVLRLPRTGWWNASRISYLALRKLPVGVHRSFPQLPLCRATSNETLLRKLPNTTSLSGNVTLSVTRSFPSTCLGRLVRQFHPGGACLSAQCLPMCHPPVTPWRGRQQNCRILCPICVRLTTEALTVYPTAPLVEPTPSPSTFRPPFPLPNNIGPPLPYPLKPQFVEMITYGPDSSLPMAAADFSPSRPTPPGCQCEVIACNRPELCVTAPPEILRAPPPGCNCVFSPPPGCQLSQQRVYPDVQRGCCGAQPGCYGAPHAGSYVTPVYHGGPPRGCAAMPMCPCEPRPVRYPAPGCYVPPTCAEPVKVTYGHERPDCPPGQLPPVGLGAGRPASGSRVVRQQNCQSGCGPMCSDQCARCHPMPRRLFNRLPAQRFLPFPLHQPYVPSTRIAYSRATRIMKERENTATPADVVRAPVEQDPQIIHQEVSYAPAPPIIYITSLPLTYATCTTPQPSSCLTGTPSQPIRLVTCTTPQPIKSRMRFDAIAPALHPHDVAKLLVELLSAQTTTTDPPGLEPMVNSALPVDEPSGEVTDNSNLSFTVNQEILDELASLYPKLFSLTTSATKSKSNLAQLSVVPFNSARLCIPGFNPKVTVISNRNSAAGDMNSPAADSNLPIADSQLEILKSLLFSNSSPSAINSFFDIVRPLAANPPSTVVTAITSPSSTDTTTSTNPPSTATTTITNSPSIDTTTITNPPSTVTTTITSTPSTITTTITNPPTILTNLPPTVTNPPPTVTNSPPTVTNSPPTVTNSPPTVTNSPPTVTNSPPTVTNSPTIAVSVRHMATTNLTVTSSSISPPKTSFTPSKADSNSPISASSPPLFASNSSKAAPDPTIVAFNSETVLLSMVTSASTAITALSGSVVSRSSPVPVDRSVVVDQKVSTNSPEQISAFLSQIAQKDKSVTAK